MSKLSSNELMQLAMEIEENGKAYYEECIKRAEGAKMRELFTHLAKEEQRHKQAFENLVNQLHVSTARYDEIGEMYLNSIVQARLFSSPAAAVKKAVSAKNIQELVSSALSFEKDTILFFYELLHLVDEAGQKAIKLLIAEEKEHVKELSQIMFSI